MEITNKTGKPLSVPLPGGKKLFLGPGKAGQVSPKAMKHPALVKLLEAGDIETDEGGKKGNASFNSGGGKAGGPTKGHRNATGAMRQSGDR